MGRSEPRSPSALPTTPQLTSASAKRPRSERGRTPIPPSGQSSSWRHQRRASRQAAPSSWTEVIRRNDPLGRVAGMSEFDLEFRDVSKTFGTIDAVDNVSLQVRRGEFLSLLGPSGCGKTTSLRLIAGFEQPTRGEIFLDGESVGKIPPYRRNVNTVFQNYALFPHMSVADNVAFGLRMKRMPAPQVADHVKRMLALVELPNLGTRFPS